MNPIRQTTAPFTAANCAAFLATALLAHAGIKTWDGSNNANWNNGANWTNNAVPVNGDDLIFPAGAANLVNSNNFGSLSVRSITFTASGYTLFGNALTISSNGISADQASGSNAIAFAMTLATNSTVDCSVGGASLGISGHITNGGFTLTGSGAGLVNFSNRIVGAGTFTKLGTGTNRFSGGSGVGNLYTGETLVSAGVLELRKTGTGQAIPGDLTIGAGATARLFAANQTATGTDVTVGGTASVSGTLDLNGHNNLIHNLTLSAGVVNTGTGILELVGDVTASAVGGVSPRLSSINGNLSLGAGSRTFNVANNLVANPDLRVLATITGAAGAGLIKTGAGQMELGGANTYPGLTVVSNGTLIVASTTALGGTTAGTALNGGSLTVEGLVIALEPLTNNSASSGLFVSDTTNVWTGVVALNADLDVFVPTNSALNLQSTISGPGGLTKNQPGLLVLSGSAVNSFSGTTTVNEGELRLSKTPGGAVQGPLVIGDGSGGLKADLVRATGLSALGGNCIVTVNNTGFLNLSNFNCTVSEITMNGGEIETGSGILTLTGDLIATASALSSARINGLLSLITGTHTFHVTDTDPFTPDCLIDATVSGNGAIIKSGDGELELPNANSYTGLTTINDGVVRIDDNASLGSTAAGTVVNSNGVLRLVKGSGLAVGNESLSLNGPGDGTSGSLQNTTGSNSWSGPITLGGDAHVNVAPTMALTLSGVISGGGTLTKDGVGPLTLTGAGNTYTGQTTVNSGHFVMNKSSGRSVNGPLVINAPGVARAIAGDEISFASDVTVASGGTLDVTVGQTIGSLAGAGNVTLGAISLTAGQNGSNTVFSGVISGAGSFTKSGAGTMTVTGTNTYTGNTTNAFGTLLVNGSQPQSPVWVLFDTTLGGTGVVGHVTMVNFGNVAPGQSPGSLTCSNFVSPAGGSASHLNVELNGPIAGSGHDQLKVRGVVALTNANLTATLGFASVLSNSFRIIDNDGADAVAGTFNGKPEGAILTIGAEQFRISYTGGTGNDVVLTQVSNNGVSRPTLTIQSAGPNAVRLLWPATFNDFFVQTNSNVATTNWDFTGQPSFLEGTNRVATNVLTGPQLFFRLIQD